MLNHFDAMATIAVKDMTAARRFYEETLGLEVVTWRVGEELEAIVRGLVAKGVASEHYEFPGVRREGDIHFAGDLRMAWLRDPAGNILALLS